jgi:hypothetical protein
MTNCEPTIGLFRSANCSTQSGSLASNGVVFSDGRECRVCSQFLESGVTTELPEFGPVKFTSAVTASTGPSLQWMIWALLIECLLSPSGVVIGYEEMRGDELSNLQVHESPSPLETASSLQPSRKCCTPCTQFSSCS